MKNVKRIAFGVPVALALWGGVAVVNANWASAAAPGQLKRVGAELQFTASTGATNNIDVSATPEGRIKFTDHSNPFTMTPSSGCTTSGDRSVVCTFLPGSRVVAHLGDGNDQFANGTSAIAVVHGGDGNDTVTGANEIYGGTGADTIRGTGGNDHLVGGTENDTIYGEAGNDGIYGEAGRDGMYGGPGNDRLDGGEGDDSARGDDGNDDLGSARANEYQRGGLGNDRLSDGRDVYGDEGDDYLYIRTSWGEYWGGSGNDTLSYEQWVDGPDVRVSLDGNGNDGGAGADCDDIIGCPVPATGKHNVHGDFEIVIGSSGGDKIVGNGNANTFYGGPGNDRLYGKGGNDVLDAQGGSGQRTEGGEGHDTCRGDNVTAHPGCDAS